ncbi:MAG: GNAT family N-acetyltransferase [Bacteroidales bacterium]
MKHKNILTGNHIILRAPEPEDVDLLYQWENDPHTWHLSNTVAPFSRFVLEQYVMNSHEDIYKTRQLRLMIDTAEREKTVGSIDLFEFEPAHRRAGIGLMIAEQERRKGYASEALELLTDYCFSTLMLHQLFCNITPDNKPSLELFQKRGFEVIGTKKDWLLINNQWKDELILQLINPVSS